MFVVVCDAGAWGADSWVNPGQGFARQGYQKDNASIFVPERLK